MQVIQALLFAPTIHENLGIMLVLHVSGTDGYGIRVNLLKPNLSDKINAQLASGTLSLLILCVYMPYQQIAFLFLCNSPKI